MIDGLFYGSYGKLIDELVAFHGKAIEGKTREHIEELFEAAGWDLAKGLVSEYMKTPKRPLGVYGTLLLMYEARQKVPSRISGAVHVRVEVFEGWGECDKCRAPVAVVREDDGKDNPTRHRLYYTCGFCGHAATQTVPAKDVVCDHHQFDIGEPGDLAAFMALKEEVNRWHDLGLVEAQPNPPTVMSIDVWEQAGRPKTWSPIWDEINKGYLAACRENRLKAYCDEWRTKLERSREARTVVAS